MLTDTRNSAYAKVVPLNNADFSWNVGFWKDVENVVYSTTVPQLQHMFDSADISHVVENFRIAAGEKDGEFAGTVFGDGDFYKWMESAMYRAVNTQQEKLLEELDQYIDLIGRAQQEDGYLSTKQIIGERQENGVRRMGDINDFEVYNFGHLFTAAALHYRLTGKDNFLKIASRTADYLESLYEDARKKGEIQTAVCPSHYMGLIELYRATGQKRYLYLAEEAIRLRDSVQNGLDDNQDRIPIKEHKTIIGHAVRANYLYAGLADLVLETGDEAYQTVLDNVWHDLMKSKIYLTGGCGALYNGASPYGNFFNHQLVHQAYGYPYQLPNITAYNETCANIGLVMWAYRMFLANPQSEYFDVIERVMLNTNLAAISLDGKRYFYENMLERSKKLDFELVWDLHRTDYITSYCCPPNLARNLAQAGEYAYTVSNDTVYAGLYGASTAEIKLGNGATFTLKQITKYPYEGRIEFQIHPHEECRSKTAKLALRIPAWAENSIVFRKMGAKSKEECFEKLHAGQYFSCEICLDAPSTIVLELPMRVRFTAANDMVEEDRNQIAVERGPLVYCLETADLAAGREESIRNLYMVVGSEDTMQEEYIEIDGRQILGLRTNMKRREDLNPKGSLYYTFSQVFFEDESVLLIPYFAWDNRSPMVKQSDAQTHDEMRVWFPVLWR